MAVGIQPWSIGQRGRKGTPVRRETQDHRRSTEKPETPVDDLIRFALHILRRRLPRSPGQSGGRGIEEEAWSDQPGPVGGVLAGRRGDVAADPTFERSLLPILRGGSPADQAARKSKAISCVGEEGRGAELADGEQPG
ncbi:MAG: hypothetical protein HW404_2459, partial [Anaerolineales bacterium]|nr:hypothetical protein [Anaerolineales bacterium]